MKITKIEYNRVGEIFDTYTVGKYGVLDITVHSAQGDGDKWYWTIIFEDKHEEMIFNVDKVVLIPEPYQGISASTKSKCHCDPHGNPNEIQWCPIHNANPS